MSGFLPWFLTEYMADKWWIVVLGLVISTAISITGMALGLRQWWRHRASD